MAKSTIVNVPVDELRPHPARALVPPLTAEEFDGLREDIRRRGVQVPLCVTEDRVVLCGHHRLQAARELGMVEVPTLLVPGLSAAEQVAHLVLDNVHRRHLSTSQRAAILTSPPVAKALRAVLTQEARQRQLQAGARGNEGGRGRRKTLWKPFHKGSPNSERHLPGISSAARRASPAG